MRDFLSEDERVSLRSQNRRERDRRVADRIKAVLFYDKGWTYQKIPEALMLDQETISQHVEDYRETQKLKPENGGSQSKLTAEFGDGVHPSMATKVSYGWIRKGQEKKIPTTASRTRMNLFDSLSLQTMSVTVGEYESINSDSMADHFKTSIRQFFQKTWPDIVMSMIDRINNNFQRI